MKLVKKAAHTGLAKSLLEMAYGEEEAEGDSYGKTKVIQWAIDNGMADSLPESAHNHMHANNMPHTHAGTDEGETSKPDHKHLVMKARNVVGKSDGIIQKAWTTDDGVTHVEGWISTEDQDLEKDIVPPEAFAGSLPAYMARKAPLSSEHNRRDLPIGHLQKSALVRDGKVFLEAAHPTDGDVEFEHFPGTGTGWYAAGVITDPTHGQAVAKGNVGGFSWIGNVTAYEPLHPRGRRFRTVEPLLESTVAAYPINPTAVMLAAKAFEADLPTAQETEHPNMDKLEELLTRALAMDSAAATPATPTVDAVSKADVEAMFADFTTKMTESLTTNIEASVAKALPPVDREGVGRKGGSSTEEDPREANPGEYIATKARDPKSMTADDKELAIAFMKTHILDGMRD